MENKRIALSGDKIISLADPAVPSGRDLAKVDGVAYSGGTFRQWWESRPMVVDLAGMEFRSQIPLLFSHMNWPDARLGVVNAASNGREILVSGGIDMSDERGRSIVEKGRNYDWQLSIGAEVVESVDVPEGEERTVNGRAFQGPLLVVTKSTLCEVSVVAVGADSETHLKIAASCQNFAGNMNIHQPKGVSMKKDLVEFIRAKYSLGDDCDEAAIRAHLEKIGTTVEAMQSEMDSQKSDDPVKEAVEAARRAENERIEAVNSITADFPELRGRAVANGWTRDYTQSVVDGVKAAMSTLPKSTGNIIVRNSPNVDAKALEAALCLQSGIRESVIEASCGKPALDVADAHLRGIRLKDVLAECVRMEGGNIGVGFSNDTIRA